MEAVASVGFFLLVGAVVQYDKAERLARDRRTAEARLEQLEAEFAARREVQARREQEMVGSQLSVFNGMYSLFHTKV